MSGSQNRHGDHVPGHSLEQQCLSWARAHPRLTSIVVPQALILYGALAPVSVATKPSLRDGMRRARQHVDIARKMLQVARAQRQHTGTAQERGAKNG